MKLYKVTFIVLCSLLAISVATIAAIAVITFNTGGGGTPGAEWLVGLGFGAMWVAFACPVLIALLALLALLAWFKRRVAVTHDTSKPLQ